MSSYEVVVYQITLNIASPSNPTNNSLVQVIGGEAVVSISGTAVINSGPLQGELKFLGATKASGFSKGGNDITVPLTWSFKADLGKPLTIKLVATNKAEDADFDVTDVALKLTVS